MPRPSPFRPVALAAVALLTAGCESALFRFVNRAVPPADASAVYAADRALALDVYRPRDATAAAPTVVFFHGGGWKRGNRGQYAFVGHRLAAHGILAIVADYRIHPRATFPGFMRDAAEAVAWARANATRFGGDPDRLFVAGHSAGAQMAALLGTDARHLRRVGLQPRQLGGVIGLSGPYDFEMGTEYAAVFGPPSQWPQAQAVNFVGGDEPPFLLVHGTADRVVEARDSSQLDALLRAAGARSTLLLLDGAGHSAPLAGLYDPGRSPRVVPAIVDFVRGR